MQEELEEMGYLSLRSPMKPTAEDLAKMSITTAIVTYHAETRQLRLDSPYFNMAGCDPHTPRPLNCIRDNAKASLLLDGQLYQGTEACLRCANCMTCITKNTTKDFILNAGSVDANPPPSG